MTGRFRYSLRTLLFGFLVMCAFTAWWVSWPERRAQQLISAMMTSPDEAEEMSPASGMWQFLRDNQTDRPYLEAQPRSIADVFAGRQVFTVVVPTQKKQGDGKLELTGTLLVTRGMLRGPIELDARERLPDGSSKPL